MIAPLHDRAEIAAWLRRAAAMHVYALADLDDFFWPNSHWWGWRAGSGDSDELRAVALLLQGFALPVCYAVAPPDDPAMAQLLAALGSRLPARSFVNLMCGGIGHLSGGHLENAAQFVKMTISPALAQACPVAADVRLLTPAHLPALEALHPDVTAADGDQRFFAPYMLERWPYAGIFSGAELIAAGGCHVLSETYGVAAIGNVLTRPDARGRGLATRISQTLCTWLAPRAATIGLNVKADNAVALRCYSRIGFREVVRYEEGVLVIPGAATPAAAQSF